MPPRGGFIPAEILVLTGLRFRLAIIAGMPFSTRFSEGMTFPMGRDSSGNIGGARRISLQAESCLFLFEMPRSR